MPPAPAKKKPRRTSRCEYVENGRRCSRDGDGTPALCNPHKLVIGDEARRRAAGARAPGDGVFNLFERMFSGKKINRKVIDEALNDASDILGRVSAANSRARQAPQGEQQQQQRTDPFSEWFRQQQARQQDAPPPGPDPRELEKKQARQRARITLGFGMSDPLTLEQISARRKELARKFHPDKKGGSTAKMQEINAAADALEAGVRAGITVG